MKSIKINYPAQKACKAFYPAEERRRWDLRKLAEAVTEKHINPKKEVVVEHLDWGKLLIDGKWYFQSEFVLEDRIKEPSCLPLNQFLLI